MALNKTFVKDNGITTSYHKVSTVALDDFDTAPSLRVHVTSYLNEEYRKDGQAIETLYYNFDITSDEENETTARKLAYSKLKTLEEWADAIDC